jgi:hypothetical protein
MAPHFLWSAPACRRFILYQPFYPTTARFFRIIELIRIRVLQTTKKPLDPSGCGCIHSFSKASMAYTHPARVTADNKYTRTHMRKRHWAQLE